MTNKYHNAAGTGQNPPVITPNNHVVYDLNALQLYFEQAMSTLGYQNSTGSYSLITTTQAGKAFQDTIASMVQKPYYDLGNKNDRTATFDIINSAISTLETTLGFKFNATTNQQLAPVPQ